jgi:hypothetical protein
MNQETFMMIDSYLDGELDSEEEEVLFEQLSLSRDSREYFGKVYLLKNHTKSLSNEFPRSLEKRILNNKRETKLQHFSYSAGIAAAVISVILLIISALLLNRVMDYGNEIRTSILQIKKQNAMIEALYNSLPPTEVRAQYSNEIIIKPNI